MIFFSMHFVAGTDDLSRNVSSLNNSFANWINNERFPLLMRVTRGNLPQLWKVCCMRSHFSCSVI